MMGMRVSGGAGSNAPAPAETLVVELDRVTIGWLRLEAARLGVGMGEVIRRTVATHRRRVLIQKLLARAGRALDGQGPTD